MTNVISGPVAPFSNPPIQPQFFQPWRFAISNISLGKTTTITMTIPSTTSLNFVVGQLVRILIPQPFGCRQLNNAVGYVITVTNPDQVTIDIDSSIGVDPYVSSSYANKAQIMPIGDINSGQINANGQQSTLTYIPGSFQNISPL